MISETYMNLHLRLGYHFNLVDARMEPDPHHNHIYFRFVGGVTDMTRRSRRAQLLAKILSQYHFKVDTKGDLVVAKVLHLPREDMEERLKVLGRLIGFTRQLDIQLRSDEDIPEFVEAFFDQNWWTSWSRPRQEENMTDKLRVMVLDDEPIVCKRLQPALEKLGFEVDTFTQSLEAMHADPAEQLRHHHHRSQDEGDRRHAVSEEAKKQHPQTEVIVITGFATMETAKQSFQKGVFDFIAKPFKLTEIQDVVNRAAAKLRGSPT